MSNPFGPLKKPPKQATFTLEALTTALIHLAGLHEGHWRLVFQFGHAAANVPFSHRKGPAQLTPCDITAIVGVGLIRDEEPNPMTVDASAVNPEQRIILPNGSIH